jgi:hypothetical protein
MMYTGHIAFGNAGESWADWVYNGCSYMNEWPSGMSVADHLFRFVPVNGRSKNNGRVAGSSWIDIL